MNNPEELLYSLEKFSKSDNKVITKELDDYLEYVSQTGDPIYQWSQIKCLFKEKFISVLNDFCQTSPGLDIPSYPNVDLFNFEAMKNNLLARLNSFIAAPFTLQRICELLVYPQKQYSRIDKYMRAMEKNVLVVSSRDPYHHFDVENGDVTVNSSNSDNDVDMEDDGWKGNANKSEFEVQEEKPEIHEESDSNGIVAKEENLNEMDQPKDQENVVENNVIDNDPMIQCNDNVTEPIYEDSKPVVSENISEDKIEATDSSPDDVNTTSPNDSESNTSDNNTNSDTESTAQENLTEIKTEETTLLTEPQVRLDDKDDAEIINKEQSDCQENSDVTKQSDIDLNVQDNTPKEEKETIPKEENIEDNIENPESNCTESNQEQITSEINLEAEEIKDSEQETLPEVVAIDSDKKAAGDNDQEIKTEVDCKEKIPEEEMTD